MKDHAMIKAMSAQYLSKLTDDTGIFQHTKFGIPDRSKGYTSDDNARALIAAVMLYSDEPDHESLKLMSTYLSFIYHAQNEDGTFRNFMDYNRVFNEKTGSEDCQGRCVWALGYTLSQSKVPDNLQNTCRYMINQILPKLKDLTSPRAIAYALIGLTSLLESEVSLNYVFPTPSGGEYDPSFLPKAELEQLIGQMATRLHHQYGRYRKDDWHWYEDEITYGNAMLPWAMYKASRLFPTKELTTTASESLNFLASITLHHPQYFKPVGSNGWLKRGEKAALYDEQPIEASEMLMACMEAYHYTGQTLYYEYAQRCYEWFHGRNSRQVSLIDPHNGGCYDGLSEWGLNLNQGSENIVSYCMAHFSIQKK